MLPQVDNGPVRRLFDSKIPSVCNSIIFISRQFCEACNVLMIFDQDLSFHQQDHARQSLPGMITNAMQYDSCALVNYFGCADFSEI